MIETVVAPVEVMSPGELLAELRAVAYQRARLDAREVRLLARFSALRTDPDSSADYAADEVAAELHLTPNTPASSQRTRPLWWKPRR
jgi:uncharacterized protein YbjT (DUF2867 family)